MLYTYCGWCKHFEECEDVGSQYEIDEDLECIGFEDSEVDENG